MGEGTPDEVVASFGAAIRAGNARAAAALFSRDGCFVTPDSTVVRERSQIRGVLQQLVDMTGELTIEQRSVLTAGDVAVSTEAWSIRLNGGARGARRTSRSTMVLRLNSGVWRIAVFDPWRG